MVIWVPHSIDSAVLITATAVFILGLIVWLEFVRMGRVILTLLLACVGGVAGYIMPLFWHSPLNDLTMILLGVAVGLMIGAVLFRLAQALLFATLVALLCGGVLASHDGVFVAPTKSPTHIATSTLHPSLHTTTMKSPHTVTTQPLTLRRRLGNNIHTEYQNMAARIAWLNKSEKAKIMASAAIGLLLVMLLGLLFPRLISLIGGAWLGAAMIVWAVAVFTRRFDPGMLQTIHGVVRPMWIYVGLGILGMAIQCRHLLKSYKKKKKESKSTTGKAEK